MAQNITLLGASYEDVPSVLLPKTGGGTAKFDDTSDADATAEDILEGKTAYVGGSKIIGTGTGGGGGIVKMGVLRPDAEMIETWSEDALAVADLGLTIPSYSTSAQSLKAGVNLDTYVGTPTEYEYMLTIRALTTPVYNTDTPVKGRQEYVIATAEYEWVYNHTGEAVSLIGGKSYGQYSQMVAHSAMARYLYWSSATAVAIYTSTAYGAYQNIVAPTITSNKTITVKSPQIGMRGHTTYLPSGVWSTITDIRIQYIIDLWRFPIQEGVPTGWAHGTMMHSVFNDIKNNGGTLR